MNRSEQVDSIEAKIPELDTLTRLRRWAASSDRSAAQKEVSAYTEQLIARTGRGMVLREADLRGLDLSGFDLRKAVLNRAVLHGTNLSGADMSGAALVCPGMERTLLKGTIMRGVYMHAFAAQVCDFTGADMSDLTDATGSLFHGCFMSGVNLSGNSIAGTTFYQCIMDDVDFRRSNLQGSVINECHLGGADFTGAQLAQLSITKSNCRGVRFNEASGEGLCLQRLVDADNISLAQANLPGLRIRGGSYTRLAAQSLTAREADFASLSMSRANFSLADLEQARFLNLNIEGADFSGAKLDNATLYNCMADGSDFSAVTGENIAVRESSFQAAKLNRFTARCAHFRDCNLSRADLHGAYLYRAMITGDPPKAMSMNDADLSATTLVQSYIAGDLSGADLRGALLVYARLNQIILNGADLTGASLFGASLVKSLFDGARMDDVVGPVFSDRCSGLHQALEQAQGDESRKLAAFVAGLEELLKQQQRGST
ncbi:MAG: pentapeptide repeat-containing protein [Candidatus Thiodiazotropha sp.]